MFNSMLYLLIIMDSNDFFYLLHNHQYDLVLDLPTS